MNFPIKQLFVKHLRLSFISRRYEYLETGLAFFFFYKMDVAIIERRKFFWNWKILNKRILYSNFVEEKMIIMTLYLHFVTLLIINI